MLQCWSDDSHERPTFADLVDEVRLVIKVMQRSSKQKTVGLDVTYINYPLPEDKSEFLQEDGAVASTSVVV